VSAFFTFLFRRSLWTKILDEACEVIVGDDTRDDAIEKTVRVAAKNGVKISAGWAGVIVDIAVARCEERLGERPEPEPQPKPEPEPEPIPEPPEPEPEPEPLPEPEPDHYYKFYEPNLPAEVKKGDIVYIYQGTPPHFAKYWIEPNLGPSRAPEGWIKKYHYGVN
jgi:hypothetical protein